MINVVKSRAGYMRFQKFGFWITLHGGQIPTRIHHNEMRVMQTLH
jgi:hypothetical protein